ncbi:MAG TPA: TonB-dependent receptor [Sulfurovum sp.]|uniref:TonB-dependent receptor plug domain-containing protein n=1 Tax=Sulfurovum sp. TaxID=1969726 RepID=UPI002F951671
MTFKSLSLITATLLLTTHTHADETLEPITIISANKTAQSIQNTTSNVTVITAEEMEENGYQTVAQAINTVAGISVTHSGGLGQQTSFFVRGADSGKVLVLLDGMRLNDPSTPNGTALLESLTTNNIAQIEIIKGGSSSIWGPNASAGVINIITKEANEGVHGTLGLSYGSYNTQGAETQLSYKDKKLTAQVLASYLDTDGFSALAPRDAEKDGYTNKNYNVKLGYAFNEHNTLNLSYNRIKTDTEYDDNWSLDQANDSDSTSTSDQTNAALKYDFKLDNYSAQLHASKGEYDREYSYGTFNATLKEYGLINAYDYSKGKAVLGLEYKDINGMVLGEYSNKAVYISNIYDLTRNTLLETNLRHDNYDAFDDKTTYKIGLKHHYGFLEGFTSSANYYTSYDAPSAYQLANQSPTAVLLKPAYTKGYDISAGYKELLTVTYFDTKVEDGIDWMGDGYTNIEGQQKFSGVELQSSYALPSLNINLSANYTYLFDFEKEDGSDLIRRAKETLNAAVDYYTDNNTHFGIDAQYVGDRVDTDGGWPVATDVPTGNYTLWNLNFGTKITHNIDLTLNARNIFDKEYQSVYGYATEGRAVYGKIKYSF